VQCDICAIEVPRRQMDTHRAAVHGINPCLDPYGNRRKPGAQALGEAPAPSAAGGGGDGALDSSMDADMMAAIAASRGDMPPDEAHHDDDEALQAALQASLAAEAGSRRAASRPTAPSLPPSSAPSSSSLSSWPSVEMNDDEALHAALQASMAVSPVKQPPPKTQPPPAQSSSSSSSMAAAARPDLDLVCPYCGLGFSGRDEAGWSRHVESCALMYEE